jgi:hypothetical protein
MNSYDVIIISERMIHLISTIISLIISCFILLCILRIFGFIVRNERNEQVPNNHYQYRPHRRVTFTFNQ